MADDPLKSSTPMLPRCGCLELFRQNLSMQGRNVTSIVLLLGQGPRGQLVVKGAYRFQDSEGLDKLAWVPVRYCPLCGAHYHAGGMKDDGV